jgi:hypothetical protein
MFLLISASQVARITVVSSLHPAGYFFLPLLCMWLFFWFSSQSVLCWGLFLPFLGRSQIFILKACWTLMKAFSASIKMIVWFLSLILFMCYITSCVTEMKSMWSRVCDFSMCFWIYLHIFYFWVCVHQGNLSLSFLFWCVLTWFWY